MEALDSFLQVVVVFHAWWNCYTKGSNKAWLHYVCVPALRVIVITYIVTRWSRFLLEKLTIFQLVKKFHAFYGSQRFTITFTSDRHMSLSWASLIQSIPPQPTSWRSILILQFHLRLCLPSGLFPSGFSTKTLYTPLLSPTCYMTHPPHSSGFDHPNNTG